MALNFEYYIFVLVSNADRIPEKLTEILVSRPSEYIGFVGFTFLAYAFWRQKRFGVAGGLALTTCLWAFIHPILFGWLETLGADSLNELHSFSFTEAIFWLSSLPELFREHLTFKSLILFCLRLVLYAIISVLAIIALMKSASFLNISRPNYNIMWLICGAMFVISALTMTTSNTARFILKQSNVIDTVTANVSIDEQTTVSGGRDINLVLFIGESISSQHMSLYGYPRPTTPYLRELAETEPNFIRFDDVFSTHTHTTESLFRALSFAKKNEERIVPVLERKLMPVEKLISKSGIHVSHFSAQPKEGFWTVASGIFFHTPVTYLTSPENRDNHQFEDRFFSGNLEPLLSSSLPHLILLHSYAGHGPYLDPLPAQFRNKVDNFLSDKNETSLFGTIGGRIETVEGYDSALRYVDYTLSKVIQIIRKAEEPTVFLYFSDHGEAPFLNRGHDSSQFSHEMARVPLFLVFNAAAAEQYPSMVSKYQKLAKSTKPITLSAISPFIIDILGLEFENKSKTENLTGYPFDNSSPEPILVRRTVSGTSYIPLSWSELNKNKFLSDESSNSPILDGATHAFLLAKKFQKQGIETCYHRSNSLSKMIRGGMVTGCIEVDINVDGNNNVLIQHPPLDSSGPDPTFLLKFVKDSDASLWIDGKNIDQLQACMRVTEVFKPLVGSNAPHLIEFPATSVTNITALKPCIDRLTSMGLLVGYNIPAEVASACAVQKKEGKRLVSCAELKRIFAEIDACSCFTDITFSFDIYDTVTTIDKSQQFRWNTWHPDLFALSTINSANFRKIIPLTSDPNNL